MKKQGCSKENIWPPKSKCSKSIRNPKVLSEKSGRNSPGGLLKPDAEFGDPATVNITGRTSWGRRPPLYPSVDCRASGKEHQRGKKAKKANTPQTQRPFSEENKNWQAKPRGKKAGHSHLKGSIEADKRELNWRANGVAQWGGPVTARPEEAKGVKGQEGSSADKASDAHETEAP